MLTGSIKGCLTGLLGSFAFLASILDDDVRTQAVDSDCSRVSGNANASQLLVQTSQELSAVLNPIPRISVRQCRTGNFDKNLVKSSNQNEKCLIKLSHRMLFHRCSEAHDCCMSVHSNYQHWDTKEEEGYKLGYSSATWFGLASIKGQSLMQIWTREETENMTVLLR